MITLTTYNFFKKLTELSFVEEIWLFGSRARGDHRERSDIDLAIVCPKATDQEWSQILEIIEDADTLLHIDCIRFDALAEGEKIRDAILRFRKIVYKKE